MDFHPHASVQERYTERRLRLLEMIWEAASRGLPCPTNAEFAAELGGITKGWVCTILKHLVDDGRITITKARFKGPRVVTLKASGLKTADPVILRMESALENVSAQFEVPRHAMRGPERHKRQVRARQAFCLLAKEGGASSTQVGDFLARDHSTIVYSWQQAREWEQRDPFFAKRIGAARAQVFGIAA